MNRIAITLLSLALGTGCFAARGVRPVGEGKVAAGLSVGGPMFTNLGGAIPTPLATAYVRYGLSATTDLDAGLTFPTNKAAGIDFGASHLFLAQDGWKPAVTAGGRATVWGNVYGFTSKLDANGRPYEVKPRVFPEVYGYASWLVGERSLAYAGLDLFSQVEHGYVRATALAGFEWRPVPLFGLQLELKQMAFATNQRFATVDFLGPADYGALALNLAFNFHLGAE